jgi:hydroxymethylbilane synthase
LKPVRIGSRGSALALWQADFIADALRAMGCEASIQIIRTTGDRMQESSAPVLEGKGIFTREIEEALLAGTIDLAVHSLKDLPTEIAPAFTLAAIPQRADARDVLVSERYSSLADLPQGAVVGTGSPRRQVQLLRWRPDLKCIEFRGNVDTRLKKLAGGQADAIVLAAAGLERLQKTEWIRQRFPVEVLCPAPGQGALAVECRAGDPQTQAAIRPLDHAETRAAVAAERAFLAAMGGGCDAPVGAYCRRDADGEWTLTAIAALEPGVLATGEKRGPEPLVLAQSLAQDLLQEPHQAQHHELGEQRPAPGRHGSGR